MNEATCPSCGGSVYYDLTCHTYESNGRFMHCLPCDSAYEYGCDGHGDDGDGCGWSYIHGLNSRNPRSVENETKRPTWLPPGARIGDRPAGIRWVWD